MSDSKMTTYEEIAKELYPVEIESLPFHGVIGLRHSNDVCDLKIF